MHQKYLNDGEGLPVAIPRRMTTIQLKPGRSEVEAQCRLPSYVENESTEQAAEATD